MNMAKDRSQDQKEKKLLEGVVWNFSSELKIMLTALFILCSLATLFQFIPSSFSLSASDLRLCVSKLASSSAAPVNSSAAESPEDQTATPPTEQVTSNGVIKRSFNGYGWAAYNFITMGGYRGGLNRFAVVGLSSKPLHVYGRASYTCEWVPFDRAQEPVTTVGSKILPDWGYGRVYTVVVVYCKFPAAAINGDNSGGKLLLHASAGASGGDSLRNSTDVIEAVVEAPRTVDFDLYNSTHRSTEYDYLYCGSSLYGNISPQRVREWIAYHAHLFGERSHFVLHDAGGIHEEVMAVLRPWMDLGRVTVHDIRDQERFDGYYHNQFMVVNDCLHRYRFRTKWMFFFDVDEYIYVPPNDTLKSVLDSMEGYSQFTIAQVAMSSQLCYDDEGPAKTYRKWGFEKLTYRDAKKVSRRDRKYAVQPRKVYATGVHMSKNLRGKTHHGTGGRLRYFHYHGAISQRREPCRHLSNSTSIVFQDNPYVLETTMRSVGMAVRTFELRTIGDRLLRTRQ